MCPARAWWRRDRPSSSHALPLSAGVKMNGRLCATGVGDQHSSVLLDCDRSRLDTVAFILLTDLPVEWTLTYRNLLTKNNSFIVPTSDRPMAMPYDPGRQQPLPYASAAESSARTPSCTAIAAARVAARAAMSAAAGRKAAAQAASAAMRAAVAEPTAPALSVRPRRPR